MAKKIKIKGSKRLIVFCIIVVIAVAVHVFTEAHDEPFIRKILYIAFGSFCLLLGSGMLSVIGAIIMYYAHQFYCWLMDDEKEEDKEPDFGTFMAALWPLIFLFGFYEMVVGKALLGVTI